MYIVLGIFEYCTGLLNSKSATNSHPKSYNNVLCHILIGTHGLHNRATASTADLAVFPYNNKNQQLNIIQSRIIIVRPGTHPLTSGVLY